MSSCYDLPIAVAYLSVFLRSVTAEAKLIAITVAFMAAILESAHFSRQLQQLTVVIVLHFFPFINAIKI
jgi:hypothetical protein